MVLLTINILGVLYFKRDTKKSYIYVYVSILEIYIICIYFRKDDWDGKGKKPYGTSSTWRKWGGLVWRKETLR